MPGLLVGSLHQVDKIKASDGKLRPIFNTALKKVFQSQGVTRGDWA